MKNTLWAALPVLFLIGCSDAPKPVEKKAEKAEAITGRSAFYKMYPSARTWSADSLPIELKDIQIAQVKAEPGKSGAWQCIFVSPSKGKSKIFTWSAVEAEGGLHQGVFGGQEESYTESRQRKPFLIAAFKTDTDEALKAASAKSEDYVKKNPGKPVTFLLEQTPRFPNVTWRVIWGESVGTSDYSVFVDASTGQYLERAH